MKTIKHQLLFALLGVLFIACEAENVISEEKEPVNLELNTSQVEENNSLDSYPIQDRSEDEDDIPPPDVKNSEDEDDIPPPDGKDSEDEDDIPPPDGKQSEDEDDIPPPDGNY